MWTSHQIRTTFLSFFAERNHQVVRSSSLVPDNDPTLLFTNAGMNQFKNVFLGLEKRDYAKATSVQKCLRAGGKHNDLENVGYTTRHHTFFEMLGNFSFGDYFKDEAIALAWEFVTGVLQLPVERLFATVHNEDDDSFKIWLKVAPDLKGRVLRFGDKENFWSMGETGPCGPCSEIHYDRGKEFGCGKPTCGVNCDCDRYVELWNLVFMQYNRDESGKMTPLPKPSVDTGAGLERIAAVMQNVNSNFDIDTIRPIIAEIEKLTGKKYYPDERGLSHRVIADHIRALTFAIADGIIPSNEGRGYVLRRIARRAIFYGRLLEFHEPFLTKLVQQVVTPMRNTYEELQVKQKLVENFLFSEETLFAQTLEVGETYYEAKKRELKGKHSEVFPGVTVFNLKDTYGFPEDLTAIMAKRDGLEIEWDSFHVELENQRKRSKTIVSSIGISSSETFGTPLIINWKRFEKIPLTEFDYENLEVSAKITEADQIQSKGDEVFCVSLDKTSFYFESGGQISDTGKIESEVDPLLMDVVSLQISPSHKKIHVVRPRQGQAGLVKKDIPVKTRINIPRRRAIMRNHTATHLVHKALREVLGEHVHQAGSLVADDRLRFDFTHFKQMSPEELKAIEEQVNEKILENLKVWYDTKSIEYAKNVMKAMALFGEKYGDNVRVIGIGGDKENFGQAYSIELCGGTHTKATGEIGLFKIFSESGIAAGVRRIEAVTGLGLYELTRRQGEQIAQLANLAKAMPEQLAQKVTELLDENRTLQKQLEEFKKKSAGSVAEQLLAEAQSVNHVKVVTKQMEASSRDDLLHLADQFTVLKEPVVSVLAAQVDGNIIFVGTASPAAIGEKGLKAGDIIREVAKIAGGSGGGKPHLAQAGSKDPSKVASALEAVPGIVQKFMQGAKGRA